MAVTGVTGASYVDSGSTHSCALLEGGGIRCWGDNGNGQLGNDSRTSSSTAVAVAGITDAVALVTGSTHTCALLATGVVKCWGRNNQYQVGVNSCNPCTLPQTVAGLTDVRAISAGARFSCALQGDGKVKCWGDSSYGKLGSGGQDGTVPRDVINIGPGMLLSGGALRNHNCIVPNDRTLWCTGLNDNGQLGIGNTESKLYPMEVKGL